MSGKILGNDYLVQVRPLINRQMHRMASPEYFKIENTVNEIINNFLLDLFSDNNYSYEDIYNHYNGLYNCFVNEVKPKVGKYYTINPMYFSNNYKPIENVKKG